MIPWKIIPFIPLVSLNVGLGLAYYIGNLNCSYQRWDIPFLSQMGRSNPESTIFMLSMAVNAICCFLVVSRAHLHYRNVNPGRTNNLLLICAYTHFISTFILIGVPITERHALKNAIHFTAALFLIVSTTLSVLFGAFMHWAAQSPDNRETKWYFLKLTNAIAIVIFVATGAVFYYLKSESMSRMGLESYFKLTGDFGTWKLPNGLCKEVIHNIPRHMRFLHNVTALCQLIAIAVLYPVHIMCHVPIFSKIMDVGQMEQTMVPKTEKKIE